MAIMTEMDKLIDMLDFAGIPFDVTEACGAPQVCYPAGPAGSEDCICDVICHAYSYGGDQGLLEIMGLVDDNICDDVEGYLTAEDVFSRIRNHYEEQNKEIVFTYDKDSPYYTNECNKAIDYIIRNLAGVTVTAENEDFVQVSAIEEAAKAIELLGEGDMMVCYPRGMTIEDVEKMMDEGE